jgi:hypothetical protein
MAIGPGGSGGWGVTGGTRASGGLATGGVGGGGGTVVTGGTRASGGSGGSGGAGGDLCSNVAPCGGDVSGTWTVSSSCLNVSGELDLSMVGIGCSSAPVTGSLRVTGTWTGKANGTYLDNTTTSGNEQITLPASCLLVSGTTTTCPAIGSVLVSLGYDSVSCKAAAAGGCLCSAVVAQAGGVGVPSFDPQTSGHYVTTGNSITTDDTAKYAYCAAGSTMVWSFQGPSPTTTGTIVFGKTGAGGTGGVGAGGVTGTGGRAGVGGSTFPAAPPCDVYAADGGPCVAAHSTVRRLSSGYGGPLYQVRVGGVNTGTGGTLVDIGFLPDGFADGAAQDAACGAADCTISLIYDQSGFGNHLKVAPLGRAKKTGDKEANAIALPITLRGHQVYGVHLSSGVGYRNNAALGTAIGDDPETIYMVSGGNFYNAGCCFDYGNAETNNADNGEGAAEAVYFGKCTVWNKGEGDGPWVMADLEDGLWAGSETIQESNPSLPSDWAYITGMVKGDVAGMNHWTIKAGNAQSGPLMKPFDGPRPNARYNPMRKEGAIILGIAGDNSNGGQGNFFEGVMTARYSSDAADDAVQADIVATYGR